jgi:2-C-methyl-D-erythritol 4-phosphate cytidylyltransferase
VQKTVIIAAGGKGSRMKGTIPKQFIEIADKPLLMHSFECFYRYDASISFILALNPDYFSIWKDLKKKYQFSISHEIVEGGDTRFHSVMNALNKIRDVCLIAIHDAVRPLVDQGTISRCFDVAKEKGTAVPCIEISESVRELIPAGSRPVERNKLRLIQTPQVFKSDIIIHSYRQAGEKEFTDDASVAEYAGYNITLVEGNRENIKITARQDFLIAKAIMETHKS